MTQFLFISSFSLFTLFLSFSTLFCLQGYLAVTLMLSENNDLLRIVINSMKNDLQSHFEIHNSLALACIANIGGREMAEALYSDVYRLLTSE